MSNPPRIGRWRLLASLLVLGGCATAIPPAPPPTARRLALSAAQEETIKRVATTALKDVQNPVFPLLVAATEPDGATFVCGTAKTESTSYQGATPFALLLKGAEPVVLTIGGNERDNLAVKDLCKSKGIEGLEGLKVAGQQPGWLPGLFGR